ncbi:MAG: transcription elongation GreA/GreB family factor [Salibacteraceae bacterium]|jgi:transcription elongation GreA/GreB family factor
MGELREVKVDLIQYCTSFIDNQINHVQAVINSAKESAQNESKSSAGDKHETGKSLLQLEQENNAILLRKMQSQKPVIQILKEYTPKETVSLGSLIETNLGFYFIAIGIGLVKLNTQDFFIISPTAPVGKLFIGKMIGDQVSFNGKNITILDFC